jgi:hypothetical protein
MVINSKRVEVLLRYAMMTSTIKENMGEMEIHFQLSLSDADSAPMLQGYIDLASPDEDKIVDWKTNLVRYDVRDNHPLGLYAWGVGQLKNRTRVEGKQLHSRSSEKCD